MIAVPAVLVAVLIGVTVPEFAFATYTVLPFGVTASATGPAPTVIGLPAVLVAVLIGVTVPEPKFAT